MKVFETSRIRNSAKEILDYYEGLKEEKDRLEKVKEPIREQLSELNETLKQLDLAISGIQQSICSLKRLTDLEDSL